MGSVVVHATPWVEKADASTSVQLPIEASAVAGDLCVAGWTLNSATLPGNQTGLTTLDEQGSTVDTLSPACALYRKALSGTDISNGFVTLGAIPAAVGSGGCIVGKGFTTTPDFTLVPLDKTTATGSFAFGAQVLTRAGVLCVYLCGQNTVQSDVFTPPSNWIEIGDRVSGRNACMGYRIFNYAAAASPSITPVSGATTRGVGILASFRPVTDPQKQLMAI